MKTSWLKAAPLLALNILLFWPPYIVLCAVLWAVGVPLIWWAARSGDTGDFSVVYGRDRIIGTWDKHWAWMRPIWGNEQDGVDGEPATPEMEYIGSLPDWPSRDFETDAARIFQWSAIRNPTNNLRFMHYFVPWLGWINPNTIEPKRIRWAGTDAPLAAVLATVIPGENAVGTYYRQRFACLFVSQGLYAGLRIAVRFRGRAHQLWVGWKLNPGMAVEGWWPDDPCWKGVGFTCGQVRHSA